MKTDDGENTNAPGRRVDIREDGRLVARFIYGSGQFKPYLHVFGENEELLTNPGLGADGKPTGQFPHHRGIFIGWKITSDLAPTIFAHDQKLQDGGAEVKTGHFSRAGRRVCDPRRNILWRAGKKTSPEAICFDETRTLSISRPHPKQTMIDATFAWRPRARSVWSAICNIPGFISALRTKLPLAPRKPLTCSSPIKA